MYDVARRMCPPPPGSSPKPVWAQRGVTSSGNTALRALALKVIAQYQGRDVGAEAVATAAARSYADLARVVAPLIGHVGVDSLTGRALHLAGRDYPCLAGAREQDRADDPFGRVVACLKQEDPGVAADAAATVFATVIALLGAFIGEALTGRLLRKAWPDALSGVAVEERNKP
jgi:hypothetical protein